MADSLNFCLKQLRISQEFNYRTFSLIIARFTVTEQLFSVEKKDAS